MPLTLITGPANAGKAKLVLDGVRNRATEAPILVVPTFEDVDHYRRELAASGAVFGPSVMRFDWLVAEIARRTGVPERTLTKVQRGRVVAAAVAAAGLDAPGPGVVRASGALIAELMRARVSPQRLRQALHQWRATGVGQDGHAEQIGAIYARYFERLEALGVADAELLAWRAIDALRQAPGRWGTTPVFLYGFDDLTQHELDAVESLARIDGVDVTVALTWEDRVALMGRATAVQELLPLAGGEPIVLGARPDHYAPGSRPALHHLERSLFEETAERIDPGQAVRLLQSGGARAELELVGAEILTLLRDGVAPEDVAVVFRSPAAAAALVRQVFGAYKIPFAVDARVALGHTALGRGLIALLRCALTDAGALDLLAYLRTPGLLRRPELADALESRVRRDGTSTAAQARELWEADNWPLEALDRIQQARARGPAALLDRVRRELGLLFAGPYRAAARGLQADELVDARVLAQAEQALIGLAELARLDRALAPQPHELIEELTALEVQLGPLLGPGAVQVLDPLRLRGRRVSALFVCGLQEGEFPRPGRPQPLLSDEQRREIAVASGLFLRAREDTIADERALFYLCVSRPERLLALSYRTSDEEGNPSVRSFFVDDVGDLFTPALDERLRVRELSQITWPLDQAPTPHERERTLAAGGPRRPEHPIASLSAPAVVTELAAREAWPARQLESYASCPVKWLVENYLNPRSFEPDSEPMVRGSLAHAVLEATLTGLREREGTARITAETLGPARELLLDALRRLERPLSTVPSRQRSVLRRLEADLLRYLRTTAEHPGDLEPEHFELSFGRAGDAHGPVAVGEGLKLSGRIDRVDLDRGGGAAVIDYKGASGHAFRKWEDERRLQVALYMLAVGDLLDVSPIAGLYQPLSGGQRARGIALRDSGAAAEVPGPDVADQDELDAQLERMRELAVEAAAGLRAGQLEPRPAGCHWRDGGCSYPTICRCDPG